MILYYGSDNPIFEKCDNQIFYGSIEQAIFSVQEEGRFYTDLIYVHEIESDNLLGTVYPDTSYIVSNYDNLYARKNKVNPRLIKIHPYYEFRGNAYYVDILTLRRSYVFDVSKITKILIQSDLIHVKRNGIISDWNRYIIEEIVNLAKDSIFRIYPKSIYKSMPRSMADSTVIFKI